jgi:2-polyprenyl-3-methyl-5-hydroxy-6-metoxy-1,4-benzoquinol methylase
VAQDNNPSRYDIQGFAEFAVRAKDPQLSRYAKIGFPDEYRAGKAPEILADIIGKLTNLRKPNQSILDVGAGCSDLPERLADHCESAGSKLVLVDSQEMLGQLGTWPHVSKIPGQFPDCLEAVQAASRSYEAILVYSVVQYVFTEGNFWNFVDALAGLLAPGGQLLIGDIPNSSMRKRFLSSEVGRAYHAAHFGAAALPDVDFNRLDPGSIDDAVLLGCVARLRAAGFDAFIVPQRPELPMANRREDILVHRR